MASIDKDDFVPAYHQLTTLLRRKIHEDHKPGDLLPSQNEMMKLYGVAYGTVMRSLMDLQQEGLIVRERGRGTFVNPMLGVAPSDALKATGRGERSGARRTNSIGALLTRTWDHYDRDPFFKEMIYDLTKAASGVGYSVQWLASDTVKPSRLARFLMDRPVDGLIMFNRSEVPEQTLVSIRNQMPVVVTEQPAKGQDDSIPWVEVDSFNGVRLAMNHLIDAGHRRIGFFNGDPVVHAAFAKRLEAYRECLKAAGIPYRSELVLEADDLSIDTAVKRVPKLLAKKPTAIFAANGRLTIGTLQVIQKQQLAVPEKISLVGYDDDPLFCLTTPGITMVQQPIYEFAKRLLAMLTELIRTGQTTLSGEMLQPDLILRGSVASPFEASNSRFSQPALAR